jgi:beta-galactosidase
LNFRSHFRFFWLRTALAVGAAIFAESAFCPLHADERLSLNFNPDWRFIKADPAGAAQPAFDDHDWATVSAPHTYNDIDTFDNFSLPGHRGEQNQWGGRTWYRKTFSLPRAFQDKKIYIEFEAVRQVAEVYCNGHLLGVSKTGFTPFGFDLTPYLRFDGSNVLAVMCDNRFMKDPLLKEGEATENEGPSDEKAKTGSLKLAPPASQALAALSAKVNQGVPDKLEQLEANQIPWNNPHWHPAHGGIYRNVRLYITDPLHISLPLYSFLQTAGPYVYATEISTNSATVHLEVSIQNGRPSAENVDFVAEVLDKDNHAVLRLNQPATVAVGGQSELKLSGVLNRPRLWSPDYPYLYRVVCALRVSGRTVDTCELPLGLRSVRWDADTGFWLNGQHLKIHGWGQKPTDEWPGLGAAQPDWLHFYTLDLMKQAGGNWVRWGHTAAGPSSIEACDRLGLMVEQPGVDGESDTVRAAWQLRASAFRDTIIYFRNNPSILIWEGGNQKVTRQHAYELRGYMDQYDPHGARAYAHRRADSKTAEVMDVCIGTEGGREISRLPVVEGEYDREESPRRVWDDFSPPNFGYPEARGKSEYILTSEQYAVNEVAQYVEKVVAPDHCGGANWIFSDSTSGGRDAAEVARASGEVDGVRLPKEAYYVCKAMFRSDPQVYIIGHWNYPAGTKKDVFVASNGDEVELFVNGRSLGRGQRSNRYLFTFTNVTWEPGQIKAVAYVAGKVIASEAKHTVGEPVSLRLSPIIGPCRMQADGEDVALFDVEAVDAHGERCPTFQRRVDFELSGPATWRGGYNSGKTNSISQPHLDLECGINRVAVRATTCPGKIGLEAHAAGLRPATCVISSIAVKIQNGCSETPPPMPTVNLPAEPAPAASPEISSSRPTTHAAKSKNAGRFITSFSYTGPTQKVHVEKEAVNGKKVFVDCDFSFAELPGRLLGADWVQACNADGFYSAADLMEIAVKGGSIVFVAHDETLQQPSWLAQQFQRTDLAFTVNGRLMRFFQREVEHDESLTLGANNEVPESKTGNMYVVFVKGLFRVSSRQ